MQGPQGQDASQLDLELNIAVLIQVPEKAIFVVLNRRDRRDDQAARSAHFRRLQAAVGVLPEDAVILFMHAHRIFDGERFAATRTEMAVEILNEPKAIATQFKAVRSHPETIFAGIKGVLAGLLRSRAAVGNHHLREGGAIEHRAILALVLIAEMVQRQSLAGIEANDKTPLLPL